MNHSHDLSEPDFATILQLLKDGNDRFVRGATCFAHEGADWRKQLVGGQRPFATIVGCSDSRVPTELVFDQGFGDLFVIRVAGNIVCPVVVGSIEYAVMHLATPVIVVMGHERCGAVQAALNKMDSPGVEAPQEPVALVSIVDLIQNELSKINLPESPPDERWKAAVEANVRLSVKRLAELPEARLPLEQGRIKIVGAVYDLESGRVRFLDG